MALLVKLLNLVREHAPRGPQSEEQFWPVSSLSQVPLPHVTGRAVEGVGAIVDVEVANVEGAVIAGTVGDVGMVGVSQSTIGFKRRSIIVGVFGFSVVRGMTSDGLAVMGAFAAGAVGMSHGHTGS